MAINSPENKEFLARFQERFGKDSIVTNIGEGTYDSIYLWKAAIEKANKVDKEAMIDALPQVAFKAPQGEITIQGGSNHARLHQLIAETKADGTFSVIEDFGLVDPISNCKI
jgi:ABC-type branched-subunit amino acid transport system substrate-binding protein